MYYKDDFNVTFEEESAFYKYLDDVEKRAEWFRCLLYTSPSPRDA